MATARDVRNIWRYERVCARWVPRRAKSISSCGVNRKALLPSCLLRTFYLCGRVRQCIFGRTGLCLWVWVIECTGIGPTWWVDCRNAPGWLAQMSVGVWEVSKVVGFYDYCCIKWALMKSSWVPLFLGESMSRRDCICKKISQTVYII